MKTEAEYLREDIDRLESELELVRSELRGAQNMFWCVAKQNGGTLRVKFSTMFDMPTRAELRREEDRSTREIIFTALISNATRS